MAYSIKRFIFANLTFFSFHTQLAGLGSVWAQNCWIDEFAKFPSETIANLITFTHLSLKMCCKLERVPTNVVIFITKTLRTRRAQMLSGVGQLGKVVNSPLWQVQKISSLPSLYLKLFHDGGGGEGFWGNSSHLKHHKL